MMYSRTQLAQKYFHYYFTASNGKGHGIHSPFVYDFIRNVLLDKRNFYAYKQVEALREQLLQNNALIEVEDFGAGSSTGNNRQRSIASIARHAAKSRKWAQLLFRIVHYYAPLNIIELGTSLGISTSYMSLACRDARIITGEGSPQVAEQAKRNFAALKLETIQVTVGNFDDTLPGMLQQLPAVDLAFLDGNHRLEPTLRYFEQILAKIHTASVIIIDDIHWSKEMEQAWQSIQQHPAVKCTVDLFFIGLVFFKEEMKVKQHFTIRF
jgi:predicted O-methyltransferase YrrM